MFRVVKRDGDVHDFTLNKISDAIIKAVFLDNDTTMNNSRGTHNQGVNITSFSQKYDPIVNFDKNDSHFPLSLSAVIHFSH